MRISDWSSDVCSSDLPLRAPRILARDDLVDEAAIFRKVVEVGRSAHQQRVAHRRLQMPVRAIDRAIFLRNTAVIAGRPHPVMATQRVISKTGRTSFRERVCQ